MKSFAGTVCGLITIVIYGIAVIGGILYHNVYVIAWRNNFPDTRVEYTSMYFITWISFLCAAAIISAIHHALWTIIDNQFSLYAELKKQNNMLEEIKRMQGNSNAIPIGSDNRSNLSNWNQDAPKQWTCDSCGTVNMKSQCTNCGQMRN